MTTCERCGREPGSPYSFLYGTSVTRAGATPNSYVTTSTLEGVGTLLLGGRCARRRKIRAWVLLGATLATAAAAALILFFGVESGDQTMVYGMPVVVVFLVGGVALIAALVNGFGVAMYRDPAVVGLDEAQKIWAKQMKKRQGRDYFTTTPDDWALSKARGVWGQVPSRRSAREEFDALRDEYLTRVTALIEQVRQTGTLDVAALENLGG